MGKYMKKPKITGDVAVMELSQSSMGVRTRAKTLALQRLQNSLPPNPDTTCYLQLRSRRLEKSPPPLFTDTANKKQSRQDNPNCGANSKMSSAKPDSVWSAPLNCSQKNSVGGLSTNSRVSECQIVEAEQDFHYGGIEGSCGENNLEFEGRERSTRESTPCSYTRECNVVQTPSSSTRPRRSSTTNQIPQQRNIPTSQEIDDFFTCVEQQQLQIFTEKYNFDFVNEYPLQGGYDWVSIKSRPFNLVEANSMKK